jgi:hypothetical protein
VNGWEHKYSEVLNVDQCFFSNGGINERAPEFVFTIRVNELDCRISTKKDNAGEIVEGGEEHIVNN